VKFTKFGSESFLIILHKLVVFRCAQTITAILVAIFVLEKNAYLKKEIASGSELLTSVPKKFKIKLIEG